MTQQYLSISENSKIKYEIKKSVFWAYAVGVTDENDAISKLSEIQNTHKDATHCCYAYVADENYNAIKINDDGEPSGTAGQPIYHVIKSKKIVKCLVAVVRYFGGIKLGAGGLVRAYSAAAVNAIDECKISEFYLNDIYKLSADYSAAQKVLQLDGIKILNTEYLSEMVIEFACKKSDTEAVLSKLSGYGIEKCGEKYLP